MDMVRPALIFKFKVFVVWITFLLLLAGCGKEENSILHDENNTLRERVNEYANALKASQENVAALQQENNELREKLSASEKELEGKKRNQSGIS